MYKKQTYITDEEKINCQKVADVFSELYESEDLLVLNAGRYGFVKLQYFKLPFGFDTANVFTDSQSLFDDLWKEWLDTQLLRLATGTPMEEMDYEDILKCLPKEKQKELLDKRFYFAEKTGIANLVTGKKEEPQEPLNGLTKRSTGVKKSRKRTVNLLDILVKVRTVKALDRTVDKNKTYQKALERQDKAFDRLDKAGLSKEQSAIVDSAISAANDCGAIYGAVAYKLGLRDGIRLMSEVKEIK